MTVTSTVRIEDVSTEDIMEKFVETGCLGDIGEITTL